MSLASLSSSKGEIKFSISSFELGFTSQTQSAQFRAGLQHYPIKSLQADFTFTVNFRSEEALEEAQKFVSESNDAALNGPGPAGPPIRFYWPEMNFDYAGFVKSFPMGAEKFDYSPRAKFVMVLCRDSIYTQTIDYTSVDDWKNIYGDIVNVDQAQKVGAPIPIDPTIVPPTNPAPAPPAPTAAPAAPTGGPIFGQGAPGIPAANVNDSHNVAKPDNVSIFSWFSSLF